MIIGLVGKPNVGKSTFFKAATLMDVLIANYPFATIKHNHGIGYVKIKDLAVEFGKVSNPREGYVKNGWRFVPVEMFDVAGLVEGASEGKGLGNQFLDDLTGVDAFIHVVDVSGETDAEGKATENYYPGEDIKFIERELDLWYLGILKKVWRVFTRNIIVQKSDFAKAIAKQFSGLKVKEEDVKDVVHRENLDTSKAGTWTDNELMKFARALRTYTKPMIIAANKVDMEKGKENYNKLKKDFSDLNIVPCSADSELALRQADKAGLIEYVPGDKNFKILKELSDKQEEAIGEIKKKVLDVFADGTGVQAVLNRVVFEILKYVAVYPAGSKLEDSKGNVLPDCFLMPPGSTALDFAYKLHTDIGNNFVKAVDVRTKKGVGKDYVLKQGDGLEILIR